MKLKIQATDINDREELRALLIDAADELIGENHQMLEPKLPWDGHPILMVDASLHPVLISFDPEQGQAALLSGLQAAEQLTVALPWINQVYDALQQQQLPPRLVVISKEPPAGTAMLASSQQLSVFSYKALRVNGETGLWLERLDAATEADSEPATVFEPQAVLVSNVPDKDALPPLSKEETSYFQQL
jgi:hypothetical protein